MNLMEQKMINLTKIDGCPAFLLYCTDTAALPPSFTPLTLNQEIEIVDDSELKVILQNGGCSKPVIYPASCLSLSPITADLRMDAAVPDKNLRSSIMAAMPSGKAGWKCEAEDIKELDATNYGIRNLTGIEYLTSLQTLWLDGNTLLEDISPLSSLTTLTELHLKGCDKVRYLTGLETLSNLLNIDLTGCVLLENLDALISNVDFTGDTRSITVTGIPAAYNTSSTLYSNMCVLKSRGVNIYRDSCGASDCCSNLSE